MSLPVIYDHHHQHHHHSTTPEKTIIFYFKFIHHGIKGYESVKHDDPLCHPVQCVIVNLKTAIHTVLQGPL